MLLERGDRHGADAAVARVLALASDARTATNQLGDLMLMTMPFLARHGRVDEALRLMQTCVARGVSPDYDWVVLDTRLTPLRADPRFAAILARSRAEFVVLLRDLDAAKSRGELPPHLHQPLADLRQKLGMEMGAGRRPGDDRQDVCPPRPSGHSAPEPRLCQDGVSAMPAGSVDHGPP